MITRAERIRQFRLRQPIAELERKSAKSYTRANIWTQEEMDAADAKAAILTGWFESRTD